MSYFEIQASSSLVSKRLFQFLDSRFKYSIDLSMLHSKYSICEFSDGTSSLIMVVNDMLPNDRLFWSLCILVTTKV